MDDDLREAAERLWRYHRLDHPRGEAVHYREAALALGVPAAAVLVEPRATNTAENLVLTRDLLRGRGVEPRSVTLVSRPYQQRRAYARAACASLVAAGYTRRRVPG